MIRLGAGTAVLVDPKGWDIRATAAYQPTQARQVAVGPPRGGLRSRAPRAELRTELMTPSWSRGRGGMSLFTAADHHEHTAAQVYDVSGGRP
jgi:bifunctional ADP-heptose synthase (sugar kinase/adenylyltransferase)